MYTYAIAWGCLVPFFPAALADSDTLKRDIEKLSVWSLCHFGSLADDNSEIALFSNISAMAVHGAEDKATKTPKSINKGKLMHVGLRASVFCLTQADKTTVGIVTKSCKFSLLHYGDNKNSKLTIQVDELTNSPPSSLPETQSKPLHPPLSLSGKIKRQP